jgi:hypothetical protein
MWRYCLLRGAFIGSAPVFGKNDGGKLRFCKAALPDAHAKAIAIRPGSYYFAAVP